MKPSLSIEQAQANLEVTFKLAKRFEGFRIKPNLSDDLKRAAYCVEIGDESGAIRLIIQVTGGIRATLTGFFRSSPKHFVNLACALQCEFDYGLDDDIASRVASAILEESALAESLLEIDLERAAELYSGAHQAVKDAAIEQRTRVEQRKLDAIEEHKKAALKRAEEFAAKKVELLEAQKKQAAEQRHIEEQKMKDLQRRLEKAKGLRDLASMFT